MILDDVHARAMLGLGQLIEVYSWERPATLACYRQVLSLLDEITQTNLVLLKSELLLLRHRRSASKQMKGWGWWRTITSWKLNLAPNFGVSSQIRLKRTVR
jgi:hypothetical protein